MTIHIIVAVVVLALIIAAAGFMFHKKMKGESPKLKEVLNQCFVCFD